MTPPDAQNNSRSDWDDPNPDDLPPETDTPGRLIDDLVAYLRQRQSAKGQTPPKQVNEEQLLRTVLHHLRRNLLPTALLGVSLSWLLLAREGQSDEEETMDPKLGHRLEEEVLEQIKGGYTYTNERLRELVDRYPWAAAGAVVGGGLLAALLMPERRRQERDSYVQPELEEVDDFDDLDRSE